jgi:hypothetical protein
MTEDYIEGDIPPENGSDQLLGLDEDAEAAIRLQQSAIISNPLLLSGPGMHTTHLNAIYQAIHVCYYSTLTSMVAYAVCSAAMFAPGSDSFASTTKSYMESRRDELVHEIDAVHEVAALFMATSSQVRIPRASSPPRLGHGN